MENEITEVYNTVKEKIITRLKEFEDLWNRSDEYELFSELAFCLLTPQSKAVSCWKCIKKLQEKDLLLNGELEELQSEIKGFARFHNTKAKRIIEVRKKFMTGTDKISLYNTLKSYKTSSEKREWLVKNIKGYGYKEASHFLRNIGFGDDIAILDRHIYKNLKLYKVIDEIPKSINPKKYTEIEHKMKTFSKKIEIPMSHLDFVFWYKEAGEIFK